MGIIPYYYLPRENFPRRGTPRGEFVDCALSLYIVQYNRDRSGGSATRIKVSRRTMLTQAWDDSHLIDRAKESLPRRSLPMVPASNSLAASPLQCKVPRGSARANSASLGTMSLIGLHDRGTFCKGLWQASLARILRGEIVKCKQSKAGLAGWLVACFVINGAAEATHDMVYYLRYLVYWNMHCIKIRISSAAKTRVDATWHQRAAPGGDLFQLATFLSFDRSKDGLVHGLRSLQVRKSNAALQLLYKDSTPGLSYNVD
ncbi:hypothetical protein M0657_000311 [Pyricularia oryzae]|nr:hypothetical protein M0657_000311 [Pyricularia oryzae]